MECLFPITHMPASASCLAASAAAADSRLAISAASGLRPVLLPLSFA